MTEVKQRSAELWQKAKHTHRGRKKKEKEKERVFFVCSFFFGEREDRQGTMADQHSSTGVVS